MRRDPALAQISIFVVSLSQIKFSETAWQRGMMYVCKQVQRVEVFHTVSAHLHEVRDGRALRQVTGHILA